MSWNNFSFTKIFTQKRILIAGFGKEGQSSYRFLTKFCQPASIFVTDDNPTSINEQNINFIPSSELSHLSTSIDLVLKSPGYPLKHLNFFPEEKITSQTDLFLRWFHPKIIGVTGTKGKSTLSSLIYHIIRESGISALLGGNIGIPIFDLFEYDEPEWIVLELSANQLEINHRSPHIALFNNLFEEHLDYFKTFESYARAKSNILLSQEKQDFSLIHYSLKNSFFIQKAPGTLLIYGHSHGLYAVPGISVAENSFVFSNELLKTGIFPFNSSDIPLVGKHNLENISGALLACHLAGISIDKALESVYSFKPLPHRLERIGTFHGITFINDSISTIPQATIQALESLENVHTLIVGGFDRGIDYQPLLDYLKQHPNHPSTLILMGQVGKKIYENRWNFPLPQGLHFATDMEEAVRLAYQHTPAGCICLLSPAAASYDQFKNFEERGEQFKKWCEKIASNHRIK